MSNKTSQNEPFLTCLGHGGLGMNPSKTAVLFIELQNEFATKGGKLHESVREVMEKTNMLENCIKLFNEICNNDNGVRIFHAPISFAEGGADNPNRYLGILGGCDYDELFLRGSWNAQIVNELQPNPSFSLESFNEIKTSNRIEGQDKKVVVINGKRGLSAFVNTDLEINLRKFGIETIALAGFMANCCVESTMRDAYDRGYNVITLVDGVATTTVRGYQSCVDITYPFFSTPMKCDTFLTNIKESVKQFRLNQENDASPQLADPAQNHNAINPYDDINYNHPNRLNKIDNEKFTTPPWAFQAIDGNQGQTPQIYQAGPWRVDVRNSAVGEKIVLRSGEHELRRYLAFAEATGYFKNNGHNILSDTVYARKLKSILNGNNETIKNIADSAENVNDDGFGWLCHMTIIRLPSIELENENTSNPGCLIYSPVLGPDNQIQSVYDLLFEHSLLPVKMIIAPTPQHHLALVEFQLQFPDAFLVCGKASGQMNPLTKRRRDLRFDGVLRNVKAFGKIEPMNISDNKNNLLIKNDNSILNRSKNEESEVVALEAPQLIGGFTQMKSSFTRKENVMPRNQRHEECCRFWRAMIEQNILDVCVIDDNRTGEVVLLHKSTQTLIISDLLYKSKATTCGPGGAKHNYSWPKWFAEGQEELFYKEYTSEGCVDEDKCLLLPHYRTHPSVRTIDISGTQKAIEKILEWRFDRVLACHTDPIDGREGRNLILEAWGWLWK